MARRHTGRRWALGGGFAVLAATTIGAAGAPQQVSARVVATTVPFSVVSPTVADHPTVSGDGRMVVFTAPPANADGRASSVWLSDRGTRQLIELTVPRDGIRLGNSVLPVISADGCVVAVTTEMAFDLFRDEDRGTRWDVYRTILPECGGVANDWELVSTISGINGQDQARGNVDPTQPVAVSGSGSVIAYARPFASLSGNDDPLNGPTAIDVVDLTKLVDEPGRSVQAAGLPAEAAGNGAVYVGERNPALSGDGNTVVFSSDATSGDAVPDWVLPVSNGATTPATVPSQVFAWDRSNADPFTAVSLVSRGSTGPANAGATNPAVSADGRLVAFTSSATNLVNSPSLTACRTSCPAQIYVVDRDSDANFVFDEPGTTSVTLVSRVPAVTEQPIIAADGPSSSPTMSADGNTVAFSTQSSNLLQIQTPGGGEASDGDLLVADLGTQQLRRAFDSPAPAPGAHAHPHLSANGRVLVADSLVAGRLLGDTSITGRRVVLASFTPRLAIAHGDLGTVTVGVPGPEWYVNVVNDGPGAFVPATATSDTPDFAVTGGSCLDGAPVPAGKSCSVYVLLTPSHSGLIGGTLSVAETGYGAITLTSPLKGSGGEPALEALPAGVDFDPTLVGQNSAPRIINVSNVFVGPTVVTSVGISGANPADFSITLNGCGTQIIMGQSCPVVIRFNPLASGRRTATVTVGTLAGQYTSIFVSGQGYYSPSLITTSHARPGARLGISGTGFPADATVLLGWGDGAGRTTLATTDATGAFITELLIPKGDRTGTRTLVALVADGTEAGVAVQVQRVAASGPGTASWPRP
ncbi:unannotated protein [freshwater metagenome]|uniref:Unannotated protein n=1 Tax=freshwater metagenome TaxID=449393 RepID=A0A6J7CND8_9ZZZZ